MPQLSAPERSSSSSVEQWARRYSPGCEHLPPHQGHVRLGLLVENPQVESAGH